MEFCFRSFGIRWVFPEKVIDLLFGWRNWVGKHSSDIWNLVPLRLMFKLWRERNHCTFEETESSVTQLTALFIRSLLDWSRVWGFTNGNSIDELKESLHFCI